MHDKTDDMDRESLEILIISSESLQHKQLTVTLPPYCQSLSPALNGSTLGPPLSPVFGLTSPSNSGRGPRLTSGCLARSSDGAVTAGEAPIDWFALSKASNSACSCGGNGGGPGFENDDRGGSDREIEVVKVRKGRTVVLDEDATSRKLPIMLLKNCGM